MKHTRNFAGVSIAALLAGSRPAGVIGSVRNEGFDPSKVEQLLKDVNQQLGRIQEDVKRNIDDAVKQTKDQGKIVGEVKEQSDKLIATVGQLGEAKQKLEKRLEEIEERGREVEQKLADGLRNRKTEQVKSLGEVVANSDEVKAYAKAGASGSCVIRVNQEITSLSTSAGGLIAPTRETEIVPLARRRMTIRALLTQGRTGSNLVQYPKQTTRTNNAAVISETTQKPTSDYAWVLADAPVRTIAHIVPISRQALDDAPQLQTEIDGELRYGLDLAEEDELLNGNGTSPHVSGLIANATAYNPAFHPTGEQMIDILRLAMLQAALAEYPADGMILNPTDWARIELTKDGQDRYLWSNPRSLAGPSLWGLPVADTQAMSVDKFMVGAFKPAATIYDRMEAEVLLSSENKDNFEKNMLTARAEKRLALAVKRPLALIYGDFGNI